MLNVIESLQLNTSSVHSFNSTIPLARMQHMHR
jgi:hypothetical protein